MTKKEYKKDDLTIVWQPDLCIHSAVCFHDLPDVFNPRARPWIKLDDVDVSSVERTVNACPSGALSIKPKPSADPAHRPSASEMSAVKVFENGPIRVLGACEVQLSDGTTIVKPNGISFCRCGASATLPFCDASHRTNGFESK